MGALGNAVVIRVHSAKFYILLPDPDLCTAVLQRDGVPLSICGDRIAELPVEVSALRKVP